MMLTFLEANVCITRAEYARLTRVTDRCASSDLQEFLTESVIRKRGGGRSVVYIKISDKSFQREYAVCNAS